ncbi:acyl-CoA dehydrogenase family protein [Terrihabitans sp. B22-R8]|uniref:acyl-CoA dehydrogenase family protein n=1 Tax=Terrihabitans sp. B22-R8 TaxID=3425128 RepID=UPI00403CC2AF
MPISNPAALDPSFVDWIASSADSIDLGAEPASSVLPRLAAAGLPGAGVPVGSGGAGGDIIDGIAAIAELAQHSLAAAFVLWGQRTYIQYLLESPNAALRERLLPDLLSGRLAGASGLSNAMKFLGGLEPLQISSSGAADEDLVVNGKLPWVTNLRPEAFHVAAAIDHEDGRVLVVSLAHDDEGLTRSDDLALMGMRSSNTAAVSIDNVRIGADRILSAEAREWLPRSRPAFVGLQCGMSIGLARRALKEADTRAGSGRDVLTEPLVELWRSLHDAQLRLISGLRSQAFVKDARPLFEIRIALADIVAQAMQLELQAAGGRAYLSASGRDFARRWREAAFIPIITPSIVQLRSALRQQRSAA